jgi:TolA-binding protein
MNWLAEAQSAPPLIDATLGTIIVALITCVGGGIFAVWAKRSRSPADHLAQQIASEEARERRIRAERERDAAKEAGFKEAAEFVKKSAESAIQTYRDQTVNLRETIEVLTTSLETHQRIASTDRALSDEERRVNDQTIRALRERIRALESQVSDLQNLTRAQQLKIDVLEGRTSSDVVDLDATIPRAQLEHLTQAMNLTTEAAS